MSSAIVATVTESAGSARRLLDARQPVFTALAADYTAAWRLSPLLADAQGTIVAGDGGEDTPELQALRMRAIRESVRWGEPSLLMSASATILWAVPVMENAQVPGGIIVSAPVAGAGAERGGLSPADIRRAAFDLLARMEKANLTNAAFLELRRMAAHREAERALAIHELKKQNYSSIRDIYLVEEPALIAAIKQGNRAAAREILNRVLVGIYFLGRDHPPLLKSFLLELVVMMSRSAVDAGGDPTELLGSNYSAFAELAQIDSEEALTAWLVAMLERIIDAIKPDRRYPIGMLLGAAMAHMQEHLSEELSRDDVARVACLSPSHFSRLVKQTFGQSFTELQAKMRVDKAREMLVLTEKSLLEIALECGFTDQSYFTKVFQKWTGRTPGEYRRLHRSTL